MEELLVLKIDWLLQVTFLGLDIVHSHEVTQPDARHGLPDGVHVNVCPAVTPVFDRDRCQVRFEVGGVVKVVPAEEVG